MKEKMTVQGVEKNSPPTQPNVGWMLSLEANALESHVGVCYESYGQANPDFSFLAVENFNPLHCTLSRVWETVPFKLLLPSFG